MIITTERLHYLWAVAETGSFAAAGRRLGVSGAAVQQVIRHFEQDLDAPLFRRSPGRSPVLTDLGRQFYFHALDIIPRLEGLENLAATRGQGQEGQLRIGLHGFVMFPEVRAALVELQQAFPLLEIFLLTARIPSCIATSCASWTAAPAIRWTSCWPRRACATITAASRSWPGASSGAWWPLPTIP